MPLLLNVLIDEDEQVVAGATDAGSLEAIAEVIADDADSLADDGGMDDLLDAADGDPELAWLSTDGPAVCLSTGRPLPEQVRRQYGDLGRPEGRALFVSGDDEPAAVVALQYDTDEAAKDDLEAREDLIEHGVDLQDEGALRRARRLLDRSGGRGAVDRGGLRRGAQEAVRAENNGGGPGVCLPEIAD